MQRFLARFQEHALVELNDSIERINMDRLNRDLRRAIDFESLEIDSPDPDRLLEDRLRGLTRQQIESLPLLRGASAAEYREQGCSICLNDFSRGDRIRKLPCEHAFHAKCIDNWLERARECPNCKRLAVGEDRLAAGE